MANVCCVLKSAETNCKGEYENIDPNNELCLNDYDAVKMVSILGIKIN